MTVTLKSSKQEALLRGSRTKKKRQGWISRVYEWFLELPIPIVLVAMWLTGGAFISVVALALYFLWLALNVAVGS